MWNVAKVKHLSIESRKDENGIPVKGRKRLLIMNTLHYFTSFNPTGFVTPLGWMLQGASPLIFL